jgi:hypothetical protein
LRCSSSVPNLAAWSQSAPYLLAVDRSPHAARPFLLHPPTHPAHPARARCVQRDEGAKPLRHGRRLQVRFCDCSACLGWLASVIVFIVSGLQHVLPVLPFELAARCGLSRPLLRSFPCCVLFLAAVLLLPLSRSDALDACRLEIVWIESDLLEPETKVSLIFLLSSVHFSPTCCVAPLASPRSVSDCEMFLSP